MKQPLQKILVWRSGALGDFVVTLPALQLLRSLFPAVKIRLVGNPAFLNLAAPDTVVDQNSAALAPLFTKADLPSATRLLFADVDFALAYTTDLDGVFGTHLAELVPNTRILDPTPPNAYMGHMANFLAGPVQLFSPQYQVPLPHLHLTKVGQTYAHEAWSTIDRSGPVIGIHPGSGGREKCWPLNSYLILARVLQQYCRRIIFFCGPADGDLVDFLRTQPFPLLTPPTPAALAAALQPLSLFIGNDSGPGHLAAALNRPTLTLFGPTRVERWKPLGHHVRVLRAPSKDLKNLPPNQVLDACLEILDAFSPRYGKHV